MIGIGIEHDVVAIPKPVVAVVIVGGSNAKKEAVKAEAIAVPASEAVDVGGAKSAWKMSVLPGAVEVVTGIVPAAIMADPAIVIRIHVGRIRMSGLLCKIPRSAIPIPITPTIAPTICGHRRTFRRRSAGTIRGHRRTFRWSSAATI